MAFTVGMSEELPGEESFVPATPAETRIDFLKRATRTSVPIRNVFVQQPRNAPSRPGMLHHLVRSSDRRALRAYTIILAYTSKENDDGWTTTLDSGLWARSFGATETLDLPAARTAAERTLARLAKLKLISYRRQRGSPNISVTLLREDGSGDPYDRPNGRSVADRFFSLPHLFWERQLDEQLSVPEFAMLLTILKERAHAEFPAERMREWYGWSADTTLRGLKGLTERKLVERRKSWRKDPRSPVGFTEAFQYQPELWLRPSRASKTTPKKKRKPRATKAAAKKQPKRTAASKRTAT